MKVLLDANSIILLTRIGGDFTVREDAVFYTVGIAAYELGNAVWKDLHIFKKLTGNEAKVLLATYHQTLLRLKIESQTELSERHEILENADKYGLTYYDSSYLTAAIYLEATLITEDKGLKRASKQIGLPCSIAADLT